MDNSKLFDLLRSAPGVEVVLDAEVAPLVDPKPLFNSINVYTHITKPTNKLSIYSASEVKNAWLEENLATLRLTSECYIFVISFSAAWQWTKIRIPEDNSWLSVLFANKELEDMMILSATGDSFFGVITDEWKYDAYLGRPDDWL